MSKKRRRPTIELLREKALRELMGQPGFRLVLRWWLEETGMDGPIYVQGSPDSAERILWLEGRRSMGIQFRTYAEDANPSAWGTLLAEGHAERQPSAAAEDDEGAAEPAQEEGSDGGSSE